VDIADQNQPLPHLSASALGCPSQRSAKYATVTGFALLAAMTAGRQGREGRS
jgi:hypothetical protein